MSQKRVIKFHLIVFVVLLSMYITALLYLFHENSDHFNKEVYAYSKNNIMVIDALSMIGTNLYIHKKALLRFVNSREEKWVNYMNDAQAGIQKHFDWLENVNKTTFDLWVPVPKYWTDNPQEKLKNQIIDFQKGRTGEEHFQRLFYLVRYNLNLYFDRTSKLLKLDINAPGNESLLPLKEEEETVNLLYSGINQLVIVYNELFWDHTLSENSRYHQNTRFYFYILMVSSVILLLYAMIMLVRVFKFFYAQRAQDQSENLAVLGAQDLSTGLFNKNSFEKFARTEILRARRRKYDLTILLFRIVPYKRLMKTWGESATHLVVYQIASLLKKTIRLYDGVYRYSEDTFAMMMPETNRGYIKAIIDRLKNFISKDPFLIKNHFRTDHIHVGFACYPTDGHSIEDLVRHASEQISPEEKSSTEKNETTNDPAAPQPLPPKNRAPLPETFEGLNRATTTH